MRYLCTSCKYQTVNKQCYFEHLERQHEGKSMETIPTSKMPTHYCLLCDYKTHKKQHLRAHQVTHLNIKLYQCSQCNYKTYRECELKRHTKSIHEHFRYHCDICPYTTTRIRYLRDHQKFVHKLPEDIS